MPLIIGRALKLTPEQTALLINADLLACGIVTIIQSLGLTPLFGIRLPVMMGVTFAAVGPMVAMANANGGTDGARAIFGAIIGAGIVAMVNVLAVKAPDSWGWLRLSLDQGPVGAGFLAYVFIKLVKGHAKQVHPLMYVVAALFVIYFIQGALIGLIN